MKYFLRLDGSGWAIDARDARSLALVETLACGGGGNSQEALEYGLAMAEELGFVVLIVADEAMAYGCPLERDPSMQRFGLEVIS